jgi:hypothetical protein
MFRPKTAGLIILILLSSLACSVSVDLFGKAEPTATSTQLPTTEVSVADPIKQTVEAATTSTESAKATSAQTLEPNINFAATETNRNPAPLTPPTEFNLQTPEVSAGFSKTIQELKDAGEIASTDGEYVRLEDYDKSLAQLEYYQWDDTGYEPENFVVSADVHWSSASQTANWQYSGCGFLFSFVDDENHDYGYLGLDGYVGLYTLKNGNEREIAFQKIPGGIDIPDGSAQIMLVVSGKRISFYVNGDRLTSASDSTLKAGELSYLIMSGTNKDYGTRCQMSNVDLFILK